MGIEIERLSPSTDLEPAFSIRKEGAELIYYGVPKSREKEAFISMLDKFSKAEPPPSGSIEIKVFTTPSCNFCPKSVAAAGEVILRKGGVLRIYDATEFERISKIYSVTSVPKIVINDSLFIEMQTTQKKYQKAILEGLKLLNI